MGWRARRRQEGWRRYAGICEDLPMTFANLRTAAWRKIRLWFFHTEGYQLSAEEHLANGLINAWIVSLLLLVVVAVLSSITAVTSAVASAGRVFLQLPGLAQLLIALSCPFVMVWCKRSAPLIYGATEVVVGAFITVPALENLQTKRNGAEWVVLFVALYWMSRGAQNLTDGFMARDERLDR